MAQGRLVKVVLSNRTTLLNGFKGPDFSIISLTPEDLLKNIDEVKPTPIFKYASNIVRAITRDEVLGLLKLENEAVVEATVVDTSAITEPVLEEKVEELLPPVVDTTSTDVTPAEDNAVDAETPVEKVEDVQEDTTENVEVPAAPVAPANTTQFKKNRR